MLGEGEQKNKCVASAAIYLIFFYFVFMMFSPENEMNLLSNVCLFVFPSVCPIGWIRKST
jgi:hypothetical protein